MRPGWVQSSSKRFWLGARLGGRVMPAIGQIGPTDWTNYFGSLLLGYYDVTGRPHYAGRAGRYLAPSAGPPT